MCADKRLFNLEEDGEMLILSPVVNLSELELSFLDGELRALMDYLESIGHRDIILDFDGTDYYGSTALGFFLRLWKRVRSLDRNMAFCNVSSHEREVLRLTRLDTLWPICNTRRDAIELLRASD